MHVLDAQAKPPAITQRRFDFVCRIANDDSDVGNPRVLNRL